MRVSELPAVLEQQNQELAILNSIATALNESVDLRTCLGVALSRVAELLDLRTGWIWLLDEETGEPYLAAVENLPSPLADHPAWMDGVCYCLTSFRRLPLAGPANVDSCPSTERMGGDQAEPRFHASIPIRARGRQLGVMNLATTSWRQFSSDELRTLNIIGEMLGVAIERSRLFERNARAGASEERNRLAREIHDTLAQGLAASVLQLETAEALLDAEADPRRIQQAVHEALSVTRQNLVDARRSVLDLRPAPLQGATLSEALRDLCARSSTHPPEVRFEGVGSTRALPTRFEDGLFRVAQEALANALRHADPQTVTIRLDLGAKQVVLTVADDGRGFNVDERCAFLDGTQRAERFGLTGICERIRLLGGEFRLNSTPGAGTTLQAVVPVD